MNQADCYKKKYSKVWTNFKKEYSAIICLSIILLLAILCFSAPLFTSYSYEEQDLSRATLSPSKSHWFGTDLLGRDLFSRLLYGGRISFSIAIVASFVSLFIGVTYGSISGWMGEGIDRALMRIVDIIYSLPYTIFVILLMVFIGRGLLPLFIAIGAVEWLSMARLVRGQVMQIKHQQYVRASKALGQTNLYVILKHVLPNIAGTIIVSITLTIPNVMLLESFISFLGLGVQAPMTSWGDLIREGALNMEAAPWLLIFPSILFSLTLFSLNTLGDRLRDTFNPKT